MKDTNHFSTGFRSRLIAPFILLSFFVLSCNAPDHTPENEESNNPPEVKENDGSQKTTMEYVRSFINYTASEENMQIRMAEIALAEAENTPVREFAKEIERDLETINKKLNKIAGNFSQDLSKDMLQPHVDIYNEVIYTERDFEKKYLSTLIDVYDSSIKRHTKTLKMLEDSSLSNTHKISDRYHRNPLSTGDSSGFIESDLNNDREKVYTYEKEKENQTLLVQWIRNTIPVLKSHLQKAEKLRSKTD